MAKPSIDSFARKLLSWYRIHRRDLPWRRTRDPYAIWISEIMLQQTTVKAVLDYYERWLKRFPTIPVLAAADLQDVLKAWQGLGYYNRARNLHKAAQQIVANHHGEIPQDPQILKEIPGFGPYTIGAVLSIAFDQKLMIIDANIRRVFMRQLAIRGSAVLKHDSWIKAHLNKILPKKHVGDFNQGLMELGALVCRSKEPTCNICPVKVHCQAYSQNIQEMIPAPKKTAIKKIMAVVALIKDRQGRYLIQQRSLGGLLGGLWEFPGGKVELFDKTPKEALKRELKEELALEAKVGDLFCEIWHYYTTFKVQLKVYFVAKGKNALKGGFVWASVDELQIKYPMPSGSAKIVQKILEVDHH
jgi:A/G-specific adenine glycosylase